MSPALRRELEAMNLDELAEVAELVDRLCRAQGERSAIGLEWGKLLRGLSLEETSEALGHARWQTILIRLGRIDRLPGWVGSEGLTLERWPQGAHTHGRA